MSGKYTYKIKEENEDPMLSVIEKGGVTVDFTLQDVENDIRHNTKLKKELEARLKLDKAKVENIEHFHPWVKDWSDEQLSIAHLYAESRSVVRSFPERIREATEAIEELEAAKEDIKSQIGVAVPVSALEEPNK